MKTEGPQRLFGVTIFLKHLSLRSYIMKHKELNKNSITRHTKSSVHFCEIFTLIGMGP